MIGEDTIKTKLQRGQKDPVVLVHIIRQSDPEYTDNMVKDIE